MDKMDNMNASPYKNMYIDFQERYRRVSELVEKTPKMQSKRLKTDKGKVEETLLDGKPTLNLSFEWQNLNNLLQQSTPKVKLRGLSQDFKKNLALITDEQKNLSKQTLLKAKAEKLCKHKYTQHISPNREDFSRSKVRSPKVKQNIGFVDDGRANIGGLEKNGRSYRRRNLRYNEKETLNIAFLEEKEENIKIKCKEREKKQRRLSGLFKSDLNIGFIEESPRNKEEISPKVFDDVEYSQNEECLTESNFGEDLVTGELDKKETTNITPIKSKLRRKPKKEASKEEIVKYYTDKTVRKKQTNLETIFETPKSEPMTVKKFKRFVNFNERMTNVKIKKRYSKIVKYNLWQNTEPVSMDYFIKKLEEFEEDV